MGQTAIKGRIMASGVKLPQFPCDAMPAQTVKEPRREEETLGEKTTTKERRQTLGFAAVPPLLCEPEKTGRV